MIPLALRMAKDDEGFRSKPYLCPAGKLTIGYGTQIEDGISVDEADLLLAHRMGKALENIRLEPYWLKPDIGDVRQAVLLNLVYNMGWPRYAGFKKMRLALSVGNWGRAADELQDSKWFGQVGDRGPKLVKMLRTGNAD